jgi:uncharacterized membrane protein SpoIIM required for sporulation
MVGIFAGSLVSFIYGSRGQEILSALQTLSQLPAGSEVVSIFIKNSIASLTTIFLGLFLCLAELLIYKKVSAETYDFLELLTEPLYKILGRIYPAFREAKPFFRSCLFYLLFVPYFAILVNGIVLGLLLGFNLGSGELSRYLPSLLPHAVLEIPAMFASAAVALLMLGELREVIIKADLEGLEKRIKGIANRTTLLAVLLIQGALFLAAILEAGSLPL